MSLENALREIVRRELSTQLGPMQKAVGRMERGLDALDALREMTQRLAPLANRLNSMGGLRELALPPAARKQEPARGRPAARKAAPAPTPARRATPAPAADTGKKKAQPADQAGQGERECAIMGCGRAARSKGYCSAHYQKLRLLVKTGRRPADWKDDAAPNSVQDLKLPRGRAAAGKAEPKAREAAPAAPPKPKAWVRKKGGQKMVSIS